MEDDNGSLSNLAQFDFGRLELPRYYPLDQNLIRNFEKLGRSEQQNANHSIQDTIDNIVTATEDYVDFILDEANLESIELDEEIVSTNLSTVTNLLKTQLELNTWEKSLDLSKSGIRQKNYKDPEFHLNTLDHYKNDHESKHFGDSILKDYKDYKSIHESQNSLDTILKTNDAYKYLKSIIFVVKNPEDPFLDDAEDDDLAISGGKISLKDPLSLNYFRYPLISRKCSHVFEKDIIEYYLNSNSNCPVSSCPASLRINDLKPDKIMALRVKALMKKEKGPKDSSSVQKL